MTGKPTRFDADYYREYFKLDTLHRFSMAWWSVSFYARLTRRLLREVDGRRVLEVGCAQGHVLARLGHAVERYGFDLSEHAIVKARQVVPEAGLAVADLTGELPPDIAVGGFDVILARYVLEHVPEPDFALRRIAELLRPGGMLLYSVPDTGSPGLRFKKDKWFAFGDPTHCTLLPGEDWLRLTRDAGLQPLQSFSDGLWDVPYLPMIPRALQYGLFTLPTVATVLLARPLIPRGWGENLIVVARRPVS